MDNDKLGPGWDHLFMTDSRTREEREAAESKERARRKGCGRKDWWKAHVPPLAQGTDEAERPCGLGSSAAGIRARVLPAAGELSVIAQDGVGPST